MAKFGKNNEPALDPGTRPEIEITNTFEVGDEIQFEIGNQIYKGTVLKTDAKSDTPFVIILSDHLDKDEKEFCRMVKADELEKVQ